MSESTEVVSSKNDTEVAMVISSNNEVKSSEDISSKEKEENSGDILSKDSNETPVLKDNKNSASDSEEESMTSDSDWETTSDEEEIADAVYQFKITLKHIKPPIWRRILILNNATFGELHNAVINSFGWLDSHLHVFQTQGLEIGAKDEEESNSGIMDLIMSLSGSKRPTKLDESKLRLTEYFKRPKDSIEYLYDFGDNWLHSVVLEKILPCDNKSYPQCIAGNRACPPDDCGGADGYKRLLKILSDPNDPEHQDMKEWMGRGDFDPEAFDPNSV